MTIRDKSTPVLVLNAIHYGALGVTRSLGRLAVCVYNQSPLRFVPAFQSRYSRRNILWDQDAAGPEQTDSNWMFNGYFNEDSECLFGLTGQKIRQFPPYAGVTSLGVCASNNVVTNMSLAFMRKLQYRGILDMGYRFDARDGLYKVYDLNPRIGATFRLFVDTFGYDVARAFYIDMTHRALTPGAPREGRRLVVEDSDLVSSFRYHADGVLDLRGWIRSLHGIEEGALFASDDMMPLGARMIGHCRKLFRRGRSGYGRKPAIHPRAERQKCNRPQNGSARERQQEYGASKSGHTL